MNMKHTFAATIIALSFAAAPAFAQSSHSGEMKGGHGGHMMSDKTEANEATAAAVINSVDANRGQINVTHEPIPAIGWPKMTMDLPVTKRVDLGAVKPGSSVMIKLKLGRDKQYRVVEIMPAK